MKIAGSTCLASCARYSSRTSATWRRKSLRRAMCREARGGGRQTLSTSASKQHLTCRGTNNLRVSATPRRQYGHAAAAQHAERRWQRGRTGCYRLKDDPSHCREPLVPFERLRNHDGCVRHLLDHLLASDPEAELPGEILLETRQEFGRP